MSAVIEPSPAGEAGAGDSHGQRAPSRPWRWRGRSASSAAAQAAGPLTNVEKQRKLPWSLGGDAANVVYTYLAFSGPIFLLFLDRLHFTKQQIGVLLSIFPF